MPTSQLKLVKATETETEINIQHNTYLAGMPQLAYTGLSENWLLKECGHLHWMGLAGLSGKIQPDFHDENGHKSYAAFTAVRIASSNLNHINENQPFTIVSQVSRSGQARHFSMHEVQTKTGQIAHIQMLSTFVFRREAGNNQTVTRASFVNSSSTEPLKESNSLMEECRKIRTGDWVEHMGLKRSCQNTIREITFLPCPEQDFNGANFLYFASFQAYVDRAIWAWSDNRSIKNLPQLANRDLFFYGNINVGDSLNIRLSAEKTDGMYHTYWCEIYTGDNQKIADVFTQKILAD